MEILYVTKDKSINTKLVYITGRKLRGYRQDKTYPKVTQCLVFKNNLLQGFSEVVKCDADEDNPDFAYILVTKKAMNFVYFKEIKKALWKELFKKVKIKK